VNKPRTKDKLMHLGFETLLTDADFVYDRTQALTLAHQKLHNAGVLIDNKINWDESNID
jgi:SulP family sulfate permease